MTQFLVVFDRSAGEIIHRAEFADRQVALRERFVAERKHRHESDIEVVVLGGDSWEALKRTHARYFQGMRELADNALRMVKPA
ncbi:hypothetical protein [Nocardiopsis baichengensis]|uniref:hypothetical protein n=1 Tax=Nocardiopsis baichengensis TaxID=280240 RepID=UPI000376C893|nr:hypothetical protein [Nocardiopsis baichengensis]